MSRTAFRSALPSGTKVQNVELIEPIGVGGSAIVYRGLFGGKRDVAVKECFPVGSQRDSSGKVLLPPRKKDTSISDSKREAIILDRVNGQAAPKLVASFPENDTVYVVMEYIEGEQLAIWGASHAREQNFVSTLNDLSIKLLQSLSRLHADGVHHGDIAPPNIMVRNSSPALIDFGAGGAPQLGGAAERHRRENYSPVLAAATYDPTAADIYGLCASIFDVWLGRAPSSDSGPKARPSATKLLDEGVLPGGGDAQTLAKAIDLGLGSPCTASHLLTSFNR